MSYWHILPVGTLEWYKLPMLVHVHPNYKQAGNEDLTQYSWGPKDGRCTVCNQEIPQEWLDAADLVGAKKHNE